MSQQVNEQENLVNDKYYPLIENQSRFLVLYGGAMSGKSVFSAFKVIYRTLTEKPHKFLCLRKVQNTIKDSIFAELQSAISDHDADDEFFVNKSEYSFIHKKTGNLILCKGLDEPGKIKSIKGITGMWLEEASDFEEHDLDQLDIRIRGVKSNYVQFILSFNPIDENHWLKKRFFDKKDPDSTICHSTYLDNLFLTEQDAARLNSLRDRNELFYDVYCLGKWGIPIKSNKFFYSFSHQNNIIENYEPNLHLPIMVSFDFNVEPMTAIVAQQIDIYRVIVFDELEIETGSVEEMVEKVKAKYIKWYGGDIDITGDATGRNREKVARGNINAYLVIKNELALDDSNIIVPKKNPALKGSRVLCNSVLMHAQFQITKNCIKCINDSVYASIETSPEGKIKIVKTETEGRHFFDNVRYIIHAFYPDFIKNPKNRDEEDE